MTTITNAIQALNEDNDNSHEFVVTGEPSTEAEYQQNVKYVSGSDANGLAIFSDTQPYTWTQISAKKSELQTAYNNEQYKRDREQEFNTKSIQDQLDMQYHDAVNGTTTWKDWVKSVKDNNPKPTE
jgi:hypothetical protein